MKNSQKSGLKKINKQTNKQTKDKTKNKRQNKTKKPLIKYTQNKIKRATEREKKEKKLPCQPTPFCCMVFY